MDARRLQNRKRKKQVQHTNRKEGLCDCDLLYESLSPVKIAKKNNREWHHSARKKNCVHPTKLPLNCYNITAFDMCQPNNRAFRTSFFLTLSPSEIIATINFDNAREQRHSLKKKEKEKSKIKITILIIFFPAVYFLCLSKVMVTIFSFQSHSRPLSLTHWRNVKPLLFFFPCFFLQCWKPFDPQSRVLLTDWCFHTVTLAESPVFRGPRCHSGTNALEFSQIIPLCACLCVVQRWSLRKMESIYLYNCLFVSLSGLPFTNSCLFQRGWRDRSAVTFDVNKGGERKRGRRLGILRWQLRY